MLRNQKGQAMTEFALILPLLLLLLLGIVEAGRTIWAFITVQQAAREAARFAVTGRPYLDVSGNVDISAQESTCTGVDPEPDPFVTNVAPWACGEDQNVALVGALSDPDAIYRNPRVDAIKRVAIDTGRNLAVSQVCFTPDQYNGENGETCRETPGAFGVLIQGQVTTKTATGTLVIYPTPVEDHPGYEGLNVQVNTFYNLQMITPIFDAIMGGNFIRLQGRVQLQNEGLDEAAGIVPPPGINPPGVDNPVIDEIPPPSLAAISARNANVPELGTLIVDLTNYAPGDYDIFLSLDGTLYRICTPTDSTVGVSGNKTANCSLANVGIIPPAPASPSSGPVPVANGYTLFSVEAGTTNTSPVTWEQTVNVTPGSDPLIAVDGQTPPDTTVWAAGETVPVTLFFHDDVTYDYDVKLFNPDKSLVWDIASNHPGDNATVINWDVPNVGDGVCGAVGTADCIINSFVAGDTTTPVATTTIRINFPQIVLSPPNDPTDPLVPPYVRGQVININLRKHTPFRNFSMEIPSGTGGPTSLDTNQVGDTTVPIVWVIPDSCGGSTGFGDGTHTMSSHSNDSLNLGALLAQVDFDVLTPPDPTVTVDGGTTWSAGVTIRIRVLRHAINASHYLEFDGVRIDTGDVNDTFMTDNCGSAVVDFTIPPGTIAGTYPIASFDMSGTVQDTILINVLATPFIHVLEGDTAMPGQTITIQGTSHIPNASYAIYYANKFLQGVLAEADGTFTFPYNLSNLPTTPPPDLTNFSNLGIPYILKSQTVVAPIVDVATNTLTIQGADLVVTQVNVAPVAPFSTTVPVDIVVQNVMPVAINQFVDVDFYNLQIPDPNPFGPSYLAGYNFPGDVKFWKNTIAPNEVFTFSHQLSLEELGLKSIYGYVDVSNNVFEGEQAGQVANPNNINTSPLLVNCPATLATDAFSDPALPGWTTTVYGDADGSGGAGAPSASAGGTLSLTSGGSSTWTSNDNNVNVGQLLLNQSGTFSSSFGLDVQVMLSHVDVTGMGTWAKAGLEIRDSLDPASPRVTWGVARNNGSSTQPRQVMQAGYRDAGNTMDWVGGQTYWLNNHTIDLDLPSAVPVWLRISRDPGNGAFNFYYKQSATPPPALNDDAAQQTYWQGALAESVSVGGIGDSVVVGLFNSPYLAGTAGTSNFDNFSISVADPALCDSSSLDDAGPTFPPLFETCTQVLQNTSFEGIPITSVWKTPLVFSDISALPGGVGTTGDANIGANALLAESYIASFNQSRTPHFHQQFAMPDWVISTTTRFDLDLYRKVETQGTADPADKFYAVVVTSPNNPYNTSLTNPAEVAAGNASNWSQKTLTFQTKAGVDLETYENQNLYLYFYNDSNATGACGGACTTSFKFDDVNLNVCTKEPPPSPVSTRIKGQLTLNFSNGTSEALPFVKVWAYAQGVAQGVAPVYETFTIQNGEFNFYNLPPGTYTIFAQYNLVQGTQIETLSDDTTILLTASNTDTNPAPAFLNLFTLGPLP